jgi:Kef-type K+ transport system membrane component KefB
VAYPSEHHILIFLIQLLLLLGFARILGEIFRVFRQPPLTAEILVGILLGPTILARFFPEISAWLFPPDQIQVTMLETVAWLGVLFLLMETGLEIDFASAWRQRGEAFTIAVTDLVIPMALAFIPFMLLPDRYLANPDQRLLFALFMATSMTISALPIAARVLHDLHLNKSDLGFLLMSALSVNDILGWLIFSLVLSFSLHADWAFGQMLWLITATIGFTALCLTLGRRLTEAGILRMHQWKLPQPASSLTFICLLGLLCGAITQRIGIHALFGFFIAGIMAGGARALSERTRQVISQMVYAIFVPIFFASIGLKVDFLAHFNLFLVVLVTSIGITGRFVGAWVGVNLAKMPRANRTIIAIAHTPGGAMEIVVGLLALEHGLITETLFVSIVFSAIFSSILVGPWMRASVLKRREVSVLEFFHARGLIHNLNMSDREEAIRQLCEKAAEQGNMPSADVLADAVLEREQSMGTAVEEGIALPHARFKQLIKPIVIFGRSPNGIEWDSPDGQPARTIFLILTPLDDEDIQIQTLAAIMRLMQDSTFRDELMEAPDETELWQCLRQRLESSHIVRRKK